jgi:putative FmdB family regulatory protein
MPLYPYQCQKCDHSFEELVFNASEKIECPECGSAKVAKQLSMPGLPQVKAGASSSSCGDLSLPPCGAMGCRRTGKV